MLVCLTSSLLSANRHKCSYGTRHAQLQRVALSVCCAELNMCILLKVNCRAMYGKHQLVVSLLCNQHLVVIKKLLQPFNIDLPVKGLKLLMSPRCSC